MVNDGGWYIDYGMTAVTTVAPMEEPTAAKDGGIPDSTVMMAASICGTDGGQRWWHRMVE